MPNTTSRVQRSINCQQCWEKGTCVVEFTYNENDRIAGAKVLELPQGWKYRPYGDAGGEAPYCTVCLNS